MVWLGMAMGRVFSGTHLAPNGMAFNFNKRVWDGFEKFLKNPRWVQVSPHPVPTWPDYI